MAQAVSSHVISPLLLIHQPTLQEKQVKYLGKSPYINEHLKKNLQKQAAKKRKSEIIKKKRNSRNESDITGSSLITGKKSVKLPVKRHFEI